MARLAAVFLALAAMAGPAGAVEPPPWKFFGNDLGNTRGHNSDGVNVDAPFQINPRTASKLELKWSYSTVGDVSATPTVEAGGVYFPDFAGHLYKLNPDTGARIWSVYLGNYLGAYGSSRSSPAIGAMGEVVIGINSANASSNPGARILSFNKADGALNWQTVIDPSPYATVAMSPVIYNKRVYVSTASNEEARAADTLGFVPSFRGSVVALDEETGRILWRFRTVPNGYTGAAVWGSSPAVWPAEQLLFVSTGNNYSVPSDVATCFKGSGGSLDAQYACMDPTNYVDSILALELATGRLRWSRKFSGADTWNIACSRGPASACPDPAGRDYDFGQSPNLTWVPNFIGTRDDRGGTSRSYFVGAGQKTGMYWGLNPLNGGLFWSTFLGRGEIIWGSAVNTGDRNAVYVALMNRAHYVNTLAGQKGVPVTWNAGAWAALDIFTGAFKWQVPTIGADIATPSYGGAAPGPITFTNRVVFAGSTSGYFAALDANSGKTLWTYNAGASVIGGPAIYDETVFWGAGSSRSNVGTLRKIFAFAVPGR